MKTLKTNNELLFVGNTRGGGRDTDGAMTYKEVKSTGDGDKITFLSFIMQRKSNSSSLETDRKINEGMGVM